jgi:hypothetical protein
MNDGLFMKDEGKPVTGPVEFPSDVGFLPPIGSDWSVAGMSNDRGRLMTWDQVVVGIPGLSGIPLLSVEIVVRCTAGDVVSGNLDIRCYEKPDEELIRSWCIGRTPSEKPSPANAMYFSSGYHGGAKDGPFFTEVVFSEEESNGYTIWRVSLGFPIAAFGIWANTMNGGGNGGSWGVK